MASAVEYAARYSRRQHCIQIVAAFYPKLESMLLGVDEALLTHVLLLHLAACSVLVGLACDVLHVTRGMWYVCCSLQHAKHPYLRLYRTSSAVQP